MSAEIVASVASTAASTILAIVALRFSFIQNVGWKPVAFVEKDHLGGVGGSKRFVLGMTIDFWNRRKYPVQLKSISIDASGFTPIFDRGGGEEELYWVAGHGWRLLELTIEPAGRSSQLVRIQFEADSLDTLRVELKCKVTYYDPVRNRTNMLKIEHRFMDRNLGWKEGDASEGRLALERLTIKSAVSQQKQ